MRFVRMVAAFLVACAAAGAVQALAAWGSDSSWAMLAADPAPAARQWLMDTLVATTLSIIFAAPFAVVGLAICEWLSVRRWQGYALLGIAIALAGLLAQSAGEALHGPTIVNPYAIAAFLTAGLAAGLVYWLVAGRRGAAATATSPSS